MRKDSGSTTIGNGYQHYLPGLLFLIVFSIFGPGLHAARIHVPSGQATIQNGINAASSGDTVLVADGTYSGIGNRDIDFLGKKIVLLSENGPESAIIDIQGTLEDFHRGFYFHNSEDSFSILDGFTICNGSARLEQGEQYHLIGGAIFCLEASPLIRNCIIRDNIATGQEAYYSHGGGIYVDNADLKIINCEFRNNIADHGSALQVDGKLTMRDCTVSGHLKKAVIAVDVDLDYCTFGNTEERAVSCNNGSVANCTFENNETGLYIQNGEVMVESCEFMFNTGYGIFAIGSPYSLNTFVTVTNSIFHDNEISGCCISTAKGTIETSVFYKNSNSGLSVALGSATMDDCTIALNNNHGIYLDISSILLTNCIVAFNKGSESVACAVGSAEAHCCNIFGNEGGDWVGCLLDQDVINNNFCLDPLFCDADFGDFGLLENSPCLAENSPCGSTVGTRDFGCTTTFPIARKINYGSAAEDSVITTINPEIFWSYYDTASTAQTMYQIQVGSDDNWDSAEMWDSGPVESSDTACFYAGTELIDHAGHYLRIRLYDGAKWGDWRLSRFYPRLTTVLNVPAKYSTIMDAVNVAIPTDTIMLAPGIYTGDGNRDIKFGGKNLTIKSEAGPLVTIIDSEGSEEDQHRAFFFQNGEDRSSAIDGLTIRGGNRISQGGGAIYCKASGVTIKNCVIRDNLAEIGGAIYILEDTVTIINCTIADNTTLGTSNLNNGCINVDLYGLVYLESSIIAFNHAAAVAGGFEGKLQASCSDIYGNDVSDWGWMIADQLGLRNNFSDDPLFCSLESYDYHLQPGSPCVMDKKDACSPVVGALAVGCETDHLCGDTNHDGSVNVSDAVRIINFIFISGDPPYPTASGDVNCDGSVNISDAVWLINFVFLGHSAPCDSNGDGISDC